MWPVSAVLDERRVVHSRAWCPDLSVSISSYPHSVAVSRRVPCACASGHKELCHALLWR